jgi:hypothetical protein
MPRLCESPTDAGRVGPEFVVSASPEPPSATIAGVCDGMAARALAGTTTKSHLGPGRKMAAFKLLFDLPGTFVPAFSPRASIRGWSGSLFQLPNSAFDVHFSPCSPKSVHPQTEELTVCMLLPAPSQYSNSTFPDTSRLMKPLEVAVSIALRCLSITLLRACASEGNVASCGGS